MIHQVGIGRNNNQRNKDQHKIRPPVQYHLGDRVLTQFFNHHHQNGPDNNVQYIVTSVFQIVVIAYIVLIFSVEHYVADVRADICKYVVVMKLMYTIYVKERIVYVVYRCVKNIQEDNHPLIQYVVHQKLVENRQQKSELHLHQYLNSV